MGTRKGSETKGMLTSPVRKHKPLSTSKRPTSIASKPKPQHLPSAAPVEGVQIIKEWEEWEDQLLLALRKEGKNDREISQLLSDRTEWACRKRVWKLKAERENVNTRQKDELAPSAPKKKYWSKKWEDWEDQIIIAQHDAGASYRDMSKLLPPRTFHMVRRRWKEVLEHQPRNPVPPKMQSPNPSFNQKPVKFWTLWSQEEDQLLTSLREAGKSWGEIATHLPTRSKKSCSVRWNDHLRKRPGPLRKMARWEKWEERLLVSGYYTGLRWKEITKPITGRTAVASLQHWNTYFRSPDQDEPWTSEELARLTHLRSEGSKWDEISKELPGHTSNACRTQWYKETEGIRSSSGHRGNSDTWSAEEVEVLVSLHNTIGSRWEVICKYIPGRTDCACATWWHTKCTEEDGVGGPPSEYWKEVLYGSGDIDSDSMKASSNAHIRDEISMFKVTTNQHASVDARKRKAIDIPMV